VATRAINHTVPFNIAYVLLVIAAGFLLGSAAESWRLRAAMLIEFVVSCLQGDGQLLHQTGALCRAPRAPHAVGLQRTDSSDREIAAAGLPLDSGVIAAAVLGLALMTCP
jgi:hypothetical protein